MRPEGEGLARLALVVAALGTWPVERYFKAGVVSDDVCQRCHEAPQDDFHRVWQCPANFEIDDECVHSQGLVKLATEERRKNEAFWTRGLINSSWMPIRPPTIRALYVDGSGGQHTSDVEFRRCGWAAVAMHDCTNNPAVFLVGLLLDAKWTVPRAELLAVVCLVEKGGQKEKRKHVDVKWDEITRQLEHAIRWSGRWWRGTRCMANGAPSRFAGWGGGERREAGACHTIKLVGQDARQSVALADLDEDEDLIGSGQKGLTERG